MSQFSSGVGHRGASIRIPTQAKHDGKGYFEDRRPASNIDPYLVGSLIVSTCLLDGAHTEEMKKHYIDWKEWKILNELE